MPRDDEQTGEVEARKADSQPIAFQDNIDRAVPRAGKQKPSPFAFLRKHPFVAAAIALVLLAAIVGGVLWWLYASRFVSTDDAFVDTRQFSISPKVNGYVAEVAVTDNELVEEGALLVRLDDRDYRAALNQAEAQVKVAEAAIGNLDAQVAAQQAQVAQAQAQVKQAQAALDFAREELMRYEDLAKRGAGTLQRAQQAQSDFDQKQAALVQTQAAVTAAERQVGSLQAQRRSAEASLVSAQAARDQAELNLSYTTLTASQAGYIAKLSAAKGEYVQAGQSLTMFVPSQVWVTANFKETQITDMRPGQSVDIEVDAYPGRTFHGHVDSIQHGSGTAFSLLPAENATGNYVKVVQRVPVKIVFDNRPKDLVLGPGMSVVPTVRVK
ncbi:HlyD family secretion protein [Microvirga sp. 2TAF3]|uniref:HlyD family secretion protein n=1 Tax=Microvirga sp. 2TAF3 TaxID=3233014 RepID=UPI003F9C0228